MGNRSSRDRAREKRKPVRFLGRLRSLPWETKQAVLLLFRVAIAVAFVIQLAGFGWPLRHPVLHNAQSFKQSH
jgi:hypothetical protein